MKYRNIVIEVCLNGFMVRVGCQTAVFNDYRDMLANLEAYYTDPEGTEKQYLESSLYHRDLEDPQMDMTASEVSSGLAGGLAGAGISRPT